MFFSFFYQLNIDTVYTDRQKQTLQGALQTSASKIQMITFVTQKTNRNTVHIVRWSFIFHLLKKKMRCESKFNFESGDKVEILIQN